MDKQQKEIDSFEEELKQLEKYYYLYEKINQIMNENIDTALKCLEIGDVINAFNVLKISKLETEKLYKIHHGANI